MNFFPWETNGLLTENAAKDLLFPWYGHFSNGILGSWHEWRTQVQASLQSKISSMQRGGTVHDIMVENVSQSFLGLYDSGLEICRELQFFKLYLTSGEQKAVIRIKKLNSAGLANWRGKKRGSQTRRYYSNASIPGIRSDYTRLTLGYILNPEETEIVDILVTSQIRDSINWKISIIDAADPIRIPVSEEHESPIDAFGLLSDRTSKEG